MHDESKVTEQAATATSSATEATAGEGGKEVAPRATFPGLRSAEELAAGEPRPIGTRASDGRPAFAAILAERTDEELDAIFAAWPQDAPLPADARLELEELTRELAEAALRAKLQGEPWDRDRLKANARRACAIAIARHLERKAHPLMIAEAAASFAPVRAAFAAVGIEASVRPLEGPARDELRKLVGLPVPAAWRGFDRLAALERIVAVYGDGELSAEELDELVALRLAAKALQDDPHAHALADVLKAQVLKRDDVELVDGELIATLNGRPYRVAVTVSRVEVRRG